MTAQSSGERPVPEIAAAGGGAATTTGWGPAGWRDARYHPGTLRCAGLDTPGGPGLFLPSDPAIQRI